MELKHLLLLAHLDEGAGWGQFVGNSTGMKVGFLG